MSTAPVLDSRVHSAALRSAVTARLGPWQAYDYDDVPGGQTNADAAQRAQPLPDLYALVTVERRSAPMLRARAFAGRSSWRVTVLAVGRSVDEARWVLARVDGALDETRVTVGGFTSSPLAHELSSAPAPDDGRYSASTQYTYSL